MDLSIKQIGFTTGIFPPELQELTLEKLPAGLEIDNELARQLTRQAKGCLRKLSIADIVEVSQQGKDSLIAIIPDLLTSNGQTLTHIRLANLSSTEADGERFLDSLLSQNPT